MKVYLLSWANKCEQWGGNIHQIGIYSTYEKAEAAANAHKIPLSDATPWSPVPDISGRHWVATRHGEEEFVLWIEEEEVQ